MKNLPENFRDIQEREKRKTRFLIVPLFFIYLITVLILYLPIRILLMPILFFKGLQIQYDDFNFSFYLSFFCWTDVYIILGLALIFLILHWTYAKIAGPSHLLRMLNLISPSMHDSRHRQFQNTVEEIRIASGMPQIQARIIPSGVFNSLALMDKDGTPIIALTEGIVTTFQRDELQAIVAHELAHIRSGDTFYIGFITYLVNTLHAISQKAGTSKYDRNRTSLHLFYSIVLRISSTLMRFFSCFISREREYIADATAVEMTRNPLALARAIDKANCNPSNLGLYADGFTPLFIVSPTSGSLEDHEGFWANLFSTHPPPMKRLSALLSMAHYPIHRFKRAEPPSVQPVKLGLRETPSPVLTQSAFDQLWKIRTPSGGWISGLSAETLVNMPWFTLTTLITLDETGKAVSDVIPEHLHKTGVPAKYVQEIKDMHQRKNHIKDLSDKNISCPGCKIVLAQGIYEKVSVRHCPACSGKLVPLENIQTILIRQEAQFSETTRKQVMTWYRSRRSTQSATHSMEYRCPCCGMLMTRTLYNTVYQIEIDSCHFCRVVWFDKNELELLQILVEEANRGAVL